MFTSRGSVPGDFDFIRVDLLEGDIRDSLRAISADIEIERSTIRPAHIGVSSHEFDGVHALSQGVSARGRFAGSHRDREIEDTIEITCHSDISREGCAILSGSWCSERDRSLQIAAGKIGSDIGDGIEESDIIITRDIHRGNRLAIGEHGDKACLTGIDVDLIKTGLLGGTLIGGPIEFAGFEIEASRAIIDGYNAGGADFSDLSRQFIDLDKHTVSVANAPELPHIIGSDR